MEKRLYKDYLDNSPAKKEFLNEILPFIEDGDSKWKKPNSITGIKLGKIFRLYHNENDNYWKYKYKKRFAFKEWKKEIIRLCKINKKVSDRFYRWNWKLWNNNNLQRFRIKWKWWKRR